jgi:hypothetical protein
MQTKTITYASNSIRTINSGVPAVHSLSCSHPFSKEENELFKALSKNTHDSIWGEAIRLCIKAVREKSDYKKFKNLVKCLSEQANDNPETMVKILGEEGYSVLRKVSRAEMQHG